jgi:hypothetical protein
MKFGSHTPLSTRPYTLIGTVDFYLHAIEKVKGGQLIVKFTISIRTTSFSAIGLYRISEHYRLFGFFGLLNDRFVQIAQYCAQS